MELQEIIKNEAIFRLTDDTYIIIKFEISYRETFDIERLPGRETVRCNEEVITNVNLVSAFIEYNGRLIGVPLPEIIQSCLETIKNEY